MAITLGSAYGKVSIDASGVSSGVNSAVQSFEKLKTKAAALGQAMQQVGGAMTAAFTVPIALAGRSALNTFQEYEKSLNILGSVSNATAEEMKKLTDMAKELGADLTLPGTSAADAAQAMAELAKAGMNVNDILAASKGVLQMSAAGQLSNAEAAEITANALNVFGLAGEEAIRVADLLAAGANSSSAEVKEMADSLQMSASVFAMAGMEIEDLVTAISLMANSGIQGSDAGTSLKQMLLSLQAPSNKAMDLMKDLGIAVYDASGAMLPMRDIIEIFSEKLGKLSQQQRNAALATIFGSDAVRAANIVLLGGVDAYDQMALAVTKTGSAADLAKAMMQGLTGAMENVKSSFETASIAAIEPFKEDLAALLGTVAKVLNAFASLPVPVRKIIVVFLGILAVIGPILLFFGTLLSMLSSIITAVGALGISMGTLASVAGTAGSMLFAFGTAALTALGSILLLAAGPVILYLAFKNNFMGITDTAKQLWVVIKFYFAEGWKWLVNAVKGGGAIVMEWFKRMVEKIMASFKNINWAQVGKNMILGIVSGLLGGIPALIAAAAKAAQAAMTTIQNKLGIHSESTVFKEFGKFSGQGYTSGLRQSMDPNLIAKTMARPVQNMGNIQSQQVNMQFASGLTIRHVQGMLAENNDKLLMQLNRALGG